MLILGSLLWRTTGQGAPPPPPPVIVDQGVKPSGGIPHDQPRRTRKQVSEARKRLGLDDGYTPEEAVVAIDAVAASQALRLEQDEQKRFEELTRELELSGIEFDARYLEALNKQRELLINKEIASFFQRQQNDEDMIRMLLMAAAAVV